MAHKGQFKKGGGRIGDRSHARSHGGAMTHTPRTRTITKTKTRTRTVKVRSRRRGGAGFPRMLPLAATAVGIAYLTGAKGPDFVRTNLAKVPGVKTFGAPAVFGLGCLAVDRFVKPNRWLKLAGLAGIVLAAAQIGAKGADFKWVGDDGDMSDLEMVGDDDSTMGDDE